MLFRSGGGGALGAKLVTFYPQYVGIHTHHALIVMFKAETGEPLAVMDGRLITEMRTAAASAVATQRLARSGAAVLGILGSGVQAKSHLAALRHVRSFNEVRVWSPRNAPAFAERHGVKAVPSAADAVRGADVVVVAASSTTPILQGRWLSPGTHVNAIGATRPDWRELDDDLVTTARVFVDSREAALRESGDVIAGHIHRGVVDSAGGVIQSLSTIATGAGFTGTVANGAAVPPDSVITLMRAGKAYVNIHTKKNTGGEIRGQLVKQ